MKPLALALGLAFAFTFTFARAFAQEPFDAGAAAISVQVSDGGETTIEVKSGQLKVRAGNDETRVSAGQGVLVKRGGKASKISLLPAPGKLSPTDGEKLGTLDIALRWAEVEGAHRYHVSVAGDPGFQRTVHDATGTASATASVHLAAGTYYWRVRAVDREGLEGKASQPHKLVIEQTPPKLKAGKPKWR